MDEDMDTSVDVDTSDADVGDDIDTSDVSEDVPEDIPEDIPEDVPEDFDEDVSDEIPDEADDFNDDIPEDVPEDAPADEADDFDDDIPEDVPKDAPVDGADDLDGDIPEDVPEDAPVDEADDLDGDIPEDVPEDAPVDEADDFDYDIPEDVPEDESVDGADDLDGDIPEDVPEDAPVDEADALDDNIPDDTPVDETDNLNDAASDADGTETDEQSVDTQDDIATEGEDAASDADGTETDEQSVDTQDDSIAEAENDVSNVDGTEADEQPADTQDDIATEGEDAASDVDGAETDEQPDDTQDDATTEATDATSDVDGTGTDEQSADTYADAVDDKRTPMEKLSDYMNQHNYGQGDYPEYSQDPEWKQLHQDAYPDQYDDTAPEQSDVTGQNFNPQKDTTDAFRYADATCDRSSPQWQEAANRHLDNLSQQMGEINEQLPTAKEDVESKSKALSDYINENSLTPESAATDPRYQELSKDYSAAQSTLNTLENKQRVCASQINDIAPSINPDMRTSFRGMNGADFNDSYNDFITEPQGRAVPGFGGVCGIDETCSIVNQQTGSDLGEADGIKEYTARGLCATGGSYDSNGGTNSFGRSEFLDSKGLTFDRVEGAYDTGVDLSLDDIAKRFNAGESAGIMVKAEDLSQPELASRKFDLSRGFAGNQGRFNANHATTVAGFSYGADGKVAGVWLNDTGGWAGSNRVFVDAVKFQQMQSQTRGFAVEFSRKR